VAPRLVRPAAAATLALLLGLLALPVAAGAAGHGVPPPTPVPVPGGGTSPSPFPTFLRTPPASSVAPHLAARSAVLADLASGQVLLDQDGAREVPIASLTKLMTAVLVLRRSDPTDVVTVSRKAATSVGGVGVSELGLQTGERISVAQLLYALLLQSANDAAVALAEHASGSADAFVRAMNAQARRLGMRHTHFTSPNGLDDRGYSTALDLVKVTRAAFADRRFARIDRTRFHEIPAPSGRPREIQNRNVLLWLYPGTIGGKTGYTSAAGYCVVAAAERGGVRLAAVVLGAPGEPFSAAAQLLDYGFTAFERRRLAEEGERFGTVDVQGRAVAVGAGRSLEALVPTDATVHETVVPRSGTTFPPPVGEPVATLVVRAPSSVVRRMPLVVFDVPPPPPPERAGPWWRRVAGSVIDAVSGLVSGLLG
jgi:serine-type D-Ala-D-Ala carboxypeptidase (penicillin-binding protein 5/6)